MATTIVTRAGKGSALTHNEVDANFNNLKTTADAAAVAATALTAGAGLTGGGDLSANRTFAVGAGTGIVANADDADGRKGVRPIVQIRPKVERDLDDTLEIIETIASEKRPKENRDTAKTALAALREVQIPISFEEPIAKVEQGLAKLSRSTFKKYGAMQQAAMRVAAELEAVIAEMERQRKRRQREEEAIFWLLN